tara:strand:+ start:670 stop:1686 length:1017 start_codon:yes stop_codon:yes gene_type:complete
MKYIISFLILATIPTLILSFRAYKSYQQQYYMLSDFNNNDFTREIDFENFIEDYPNISVTTLPLSAIKAEYYIAQNKIDDAIKLFHKAIKANPYIGRSEARLADIYYSYNFKIDSANYFADRAYYLRPLNSKHFLVYLKSFAVKNQIEKLDDLIKDNFNLLKKTNGNDKYLPTVMYFYLSSIYQYRLKNKKKYDSIAKQGLKSFPNDQQIKIASNFIIYGKDSVQKALDFDEKAKIELENKNYEKSYDLFSQSVSFWPNHEYSLQNAGITAYLSKNYFKSIFYLEELLKIDSPVDGITELYLYEAYKNIDDSLNACKYYNKLLVLYPNLIDKNTKGCD